MEFLEHLVGEGTMSIPEHRAEALANYSKPTTKKGLRVFFGAVGLYGRYVELLAKHTAFSLLSRRSWNLPRPCGLRKVSWPSPVFVCA